MARAGLREGCENIGRRKRVRNDAFRVASARISGFLKSMFEASEAESVEGLQMSRKSYFGDHSGGSYRSSYASAQLFRGRRNTL